MKPLKTQAVLEIVLTVIFLVTAACGGSVRSIPSPDLFGTTVAQTLQPVASLAAPTQASSTSLPSITPVLATATATTAPATTAPAVSNLPAASRISFARGATFSVTQGKVQAGQSVYYVAQISKGQPMIAMLNTPD